MSTYYSRTLIGLVIVLLGLAIAAVGASAAAGRARDRQLDLSRQSEAERAVHADQKRRTMRAETAMVPVRSFSAEWVRHFAMAEKEAAESIRLEMESIAQRQLGLVTDNAITPAPDRLSFQGQSVRVQRVTLRASGKDLVALLTWLGKVEERFPASVIEQCEFSSNVGGNTALTLRLAQPVSESLPTRRSMPTMDVDQLVDAIGTFTWTRYRPPAVKGAGGIAISRNPLQPAILPPEVRLPGLDENSTETTQQLVGALTGRVRSVVRGASPIVVIDGRVFRIGDEVVVGQGRERPLASARTQLKRIAPDRLVFQVIRAGDTGASAAEVPLELPSFLQVR